MGNYDPLFDAARLAVDDVLGEGEYARLNRNNPGVPRELREMPKHTWHKSLSFRLTEQQYERLREYTHRLRISKQQALVEALEMWLQSRLE